MQDQTFTIKDFDDDVQHWQAVNWAAAQSISLSIYLIPAALRQLRFLATVDAHPCLYRGLAVSRAIHRYESCWLPLLSETSPELLPLLEPPLDVAWIWHVHRLNPIVYARDCEHHFGRILDYECSREQCSSSFSRRYWEHRFIDEPYELDLSQFQYDEQWQPEPYSEQDRLLSYDLRAAVHRQSTFCYQVSESHMKDEAFLRAAEKRYKGFLHLFTLTNCEVFIVPTYDIDLMWHTHQLHPIAYFQDTVDILGRHLGHDDSDPDRSYGSKLDQGHRRTSQLWFENYGRMYKRAGAMYRGSAPSPMQSLLPLSSAPATLMQTNTWMPPSSPSSLEAIGYCPDQIPIAPRKVMQVMVTIVGARNLSKKNHHTVKVILQMKAKCSSPKFATPSVALQPEVTWNHTWAFQAEISTAGFNIYLLRTAGSFMPTLSKTKSLGVCHFTWEDILKSQTLSYDGWADLQGKTTTFKSRRNHMPPQLFISVSITPPQPAFQLFRSIRYVVTNDRGEIIKMNKLHLFWRPRRFCLNRIVVDHTSNSLFTVQAKIERNVIYHHSVEIVKSISILQGVLQFRGSKIADSLGTAGSAQQILNMQVMKTQRCWGIFGNSTHLFVSRDIHGSSWNMRPLLELRGALEDQIRLLCGRKLQYTVSGANPQDEGGFVTLIRRNTSSDGPPWKATALFNWWNGAMEVAQEESVVLVLLFSNIIAMSVYELEGIKFKPRSKYHRSGGSSPTYEEWGSVMLPTKSTVDDKTLIAYYTWWNIPTIVWSTSFYNPVNPIFGASLCGAAGACGSSTHGGSACGGCTAIQALNDGGGCTGGGCGG